MTLRKLGARFRCQEVFLIFKPLQYREEGGELVCDLPGIGTSLEEATKTPCGGWTLGFWRPASKRVCTRCREEREKP